MERTCAPRPLDAIDPALATAARLLAARDRTDVRDALCDGVRSLVECDSVALYELDGDGRSRRAGESVRSSGARHVLRLPLATEGQAFGALELRRRDGQPFLASEHEIAATLAHLGALAIRQIAVREETEERARRDWLTGLFNAAHCHHMLAELCRDTGGFALVLLDFDDLKRINDTHGHQQGDEMLRVVAAALRGLVRADDLAFRLGGDEFAVVLREPTKAAVDGFGHRLAEVLSGLRTIVGSTVSLSAGHAIAPRDGSLPCELLRAADVALYASKRARKRFAEPHVERLATAPPGGAQPRIAGVSFAQLPFPV